MRRQLQEKEKHYETLESKVMTLKEDYEKINKWAKAYESLENIINEQHSPLIKTGIGYDHIQWSSKNQYSSVQEKTESCHTPVK